MSNSSQAHSRQQCPNPSASPPPPPPSRTKLSHSSFPLPPDTPALGSHALPPLTGRCSPPALPPHYSAGMGPPVPFRAVPFQAVPFRAVPCPHRAQTAPTPCPHHAQTVPTCCRAPAPRPSQPRPGGFPAIPSHQPLLARLRSLCTAATNQLTAHAGPYVTSHATRRSCPCTALSFILPGGAEKRHESRLDGRARMTNRIQREWAGPPRSVCAAGFYATSRHCGCGPDRPGTGGGLSFGPWHPNLPSQTNEISY